MNVLRLRPPRPTRRDDDFRHVVLAHEPAVRRWIARRVQDPGRAEDLTQEVFLRAWRHADRYDPERGELRGWLLALARNVVIDGYRADAARPRTTGDSEHVLDTIAVADETEDAVAAWSMADALRSLSPAHRDVLVCLYYRRWTLGETADHLGVPLGTVKSRSTYALRALKLVLDEREAGA